MALAVSIPVEAIKSAVAGLDCWLDSMRCADGYTGPVAHWWLNCLQYTGVGLDWRYEGIIIGYLNLWERTSQQEWLEKARRAGDDLVRGQLPNGSYRDSEFELNPYSGGTPHEAACDLALLHLAEALRREEAPDWPLYLEAARRNIQSFYMARLWNSDGKFFADGSDGVSFVPNKAATIVEALFRLADLTGNGGVIEDYALPTLDYVLRHQIDRLGSPLEGGVYQYSIGAGGDGFRFVGKLFPFYTARCIPALVEGYQHSGDRRLLEGAVRAADFILRHRYEDGSYPQVVYMGERVASYPRWIAGVGDVLRGLDMVVGYGVEHDSRATLEWLLRGLDPCGAFRTAWGFDSQASQGTPQQLPHFLDLLHVCGWNDKAFRYLTGLVPNGDTLTPQETLEPMELPCTFRGRTLAFCEDALQVALRSGSQALYRWEKGAPWAEVNDPIMFLK